MSPPDAYTTSHALSENKGILLRGLPEATCEGDIVLASL